MERSFKFKGWKTQYSDINSSQFEAEYQHIPNDDPAWLADFVFIFSNQPSNS